ncbi:MAG: hypothetical protein F6K30_00310 [Cyanothece sp. SIO2G6]|nr:hypothetical protein [Cyanothece sp. SIO2G6]
MQTYFVEVLRTSTKYTVLNEYDHRYNSALPDHLLASFRHVRVESNTRNPTKGYDSTPAIVQTSGNLSRQ